MPIVRRNDGSVYSDSINHFPTPHSIGKACIACIEHIMTRRGMVTEDVRVEAEISYGSVYEYLHHHNKGKKVNDAMAAWLAKQPLAIGARSAVVAAPVPSRPIAIPARPAPQQPVVIQPQPPLPPPPPRAGPSISREEFARRVVPELQNPAHLLRLRGQPKAGYVYVMADQDPRYVKIGKSNDVVVRMGNEGQGNPHLQTIMTVRSDDYDYLEKVIHRILAACKAEYIPSARAQADSRACEFFCIHRADAKKLVLVVHSMLEEDGANKIAW